MGTKKIVLGSVAVFGLALGAQVANASSICSGCEVVDGAAATYLGVYNTLTSDHGTFTHTDIVADLGNGVSFADFLIFDLSEAGIVSMSANYTTFTGIVDFAATLWSDGGSSCPATPGTGCASIVPGAVIAEASGNNWEILTSLGAGRYILQISGLTRASGPSAYSGQLGTIVPLPGALLLFGTSLLGLGFVRRRTG